MEQGGWDLSWRHWPLTILSTKLLEVMLLHWSKNWGSVPTCTKEEEEGGDVVGYNISGMPSPMAPLLPRVSKTGRDTTTRLSVTLMSLNPTLQVRPLCQRGMTRLTQVSIAHWNRNSVFGLALPYLIGGKGLRQAKGRPLQNLCQRPVYTALKASLTRRSHVLETVKKG